MFWFYIFLVSCGGANLMSTKNKDNSNGSSDKVFVEESKIIYEDDDRAPEYIETVDDYLEDNYNSDIAAETSKVVSKDKVSPKSGSAKIEDVKAAILRGDFNAFKEALTKTPKLIQGEYIEQDPDTSGKNTLLHILANSSNINNKSGWFEIIEELDIVSFNKFLRMQNEAGFYPMDLALKMLDDLSLLELMVNQNITINNGLSEKILKAKIQALAHNQYIKVLEGLARIYSKTNNGSFYSLLDTDSGIVFGDGRDLVYYAVKTGDVELLEFLISKNVDLKRNYGASVGGVGVIGFREFLTEVANKSSTVNKKKIIEILKKNKAN